MDFFWQKIPARPLRIISDDIKAVSGTAVTLASIQPTKNCLLVHITNGANPVRYAVTGPPTATEGHLLDANTDLYLNESQLQTVSFIAVGAASTMYVSFYD